MDYRDTFDQFLCSLSSEKGRNRGLGAPCDKAYRMIRLSARYHRPKTLYKYFNVENAEKSIEDLSRNRLYLANPVFFDDDYDVRPVFDAKSIERRMNVQVTERNMDETHRFIAQFYPEEYGRKVWDIHGNLVEQAGGFEEYKKKYISETIMQLPEAMKKFREAPRCACLAEEYNSSMMWGLYASKHKGFVAAYKAPYSPLTCYCERFNSAFHCKYNKFPITLAPVIYTGRKDITDYSDVFGDSTALIPYVTEHLYLAVLNATLYKSETWSKEREWRIVTLACAQARDITMYVRMAPCALYLGSQISKSHANALLDVSKMLNIPMFKEAITYNISSEEMRFNRFG